MQPACSAVRHCSPGVTGRREFLLFVLITGVLCGRSSSRYRDCRRLLPAAHQLLYTTTGLASEMCLLPYICTSILPLPSVLPPPIIEEAQPEQGGAADRIVRQGGERARPGAARGEECVPCLLVTGRTHDNTRVIRRSRPGRRPNIPSIFLRPHTSELYSLQSYKY